ncbi:MAG TPA: MOSC domain-containing protein [Verrucomicrobiae bacterium]
MKYAGQGLDFSASPLLHQAAEAVKMLGMHERAQIQVERIFISAGHNYFGHHDQPAGTHPIIEVNEVECVAGKGLAGDRFFNFKDNYKGQITFFSADVFEDVCRRLDAHGKSAAVTRRNVIIRGADLNTLIGQKFEIQGVVFEGVCECSPCHWMNDAIAPGAEAALQGRGGLRARILSDGRLRAGA